MITAERLRKILDYDPGTGVFIWREDKGNHIKCGDIAGTIKSGGYRQIVINRRAYSSHRLAWLFMTGDWPIDEIDHINGKPGDNRWMNLREASHSTNAQNRLKSHKNNHTGLIGVSIKKDKIANPYVAQIKLNGKVRHLGYFPNPHEAHAAYIEAKRELHPGGLL